MAQQSKGLPAYLIPSPKSAYIMAYRAERAMYNRPSPPYVLSSHWEGTYASIQVLNPEAARMASVSFQARHYHDELAIPFLRYWNMIFSVRFPSRVRRLPASRLPGVQPETARRIVKYIQELRYLNSHI